MLKILGAATIALMCAVVGELFAEQTKTDCEIVEEAEKFISYLKNELFYTLAEPHKIVEKIRDENNFKHLSFLNKIHSDEFGSLTFEHYMKDILKRDTALSSEVKKQFDELFTLLGSMNLQAQLDGIDLILVKLKSLKEKAAQKQATHVKLYRTIGFSAGAAIFIMII